MFIRNNAELTSLTGLEKLERIDGNLSIRDNPNLSESEITNLIDRINAKEGIGGSVDLSNNMP